MENVKVSANTTALLLNKEIVKEYYNAVRWSSLGEYEQMKIFQEKHPLEYKRFASVHRKRTRIRNCIAALRIVSEEVYFGTLTYDNDKNENKTTTKRKQAFNVLNRLFEYVVLVEEYGEDNGRYHVHFVGVFKYGRDFDSFRKEWKSRQNLKLLRENENVAQYLCKYLSKDLPRVRCNKRLVALEKAYKTGLLMERDHFESLGTCYQVNKVHKMNVFDFID